MARNKHTSISGVAVIVCGLAAKVGCTWFPAHCQQFRDTAEAVMTAAAGYGLMMAGDAPKQSDKENPEENPKTKSPIIPLIIAAAALIFMAN